MSSEKHPPAEPAHRTEEPRRRRFSYIEIKVFELVANLIIATVLMVILVGMTFLIAYLRRH